MDRHERGRAAERRARDFLVEQGLEPLDANWRRRIGEIDLIMREPLDGTVVFVEVRYRAHASLGGGLESVDRAKRSRLRRAALAWLQRHGDPDAPARIDVVAIGPATVTRAASRGARDDGIESGGGGAAEDGNGHERWAGHHSPPRAGSAARAERLLARRDGHLLEWIVSAIEDDG